MDEALGQKSLKITYIEYKEVQSVDNLPEKHIISNI